MELYQRIASLCDLARINMTEMCREAGVSRAALTDLKSGRKNGLSAATLAKISAFLEVSVDFLLTGAPPSGAVMKSRGEGGRQELAAYFRERTGRLPGREELDRLEDYIGIFLKSLD